MRKLEELVPPLELCKKIPDGAFADSVLAWIDQPEWYKEPGVVLRDYAWAATSHKGVYPAPTLDEIMNALYEQEDFVVAKIKDGVFQISAWREYDEEADVMISAKSATHAALSLWLKKHAARG